MTTTEARKIIEVLADGRCPQTGQKLPADSTFQQPDVVRALFFAAWALERAEQSERRATSLPEQAGKAWDSAEEQRLCESFDVGKTVVELARIHGRTRGAIQSRLERLGKIEPQARRHYATRL
jgi:hypothetical protein